MHAYDDSNNHCCIHTCDVEVSQKYPRMIVFDLHVINVWSVDKNSLQNCMRV
jgi:hypothetical protein